MYWQTMIFILYLVFLVGHILTSGDPSTGLLIIDLIFGMLLTIYEIYQLVISKDYTWTNY